MLDETSQAITFNRELLQSGFEHISQGVSVIDRHQKLVAWNTRFVELLEFPEDFLYVGMPVVEVLRYNAARGEYGEGNSKGQVANAADNLIIMPWNDLELLEDLFARRGSEIAAILTEPVMCNSGSLMPRPGFLEGLRSLCDRYESVLIFDEVITGFRLALGGAQEIFGVTPDLATYAKGIASGFTLSAVVGKAEVMDLISSGQVVHAGTYNSNPVVIAAGLATLQTLSGDREAVYSRLNRLGGRLRQGLEDRLRRAEVPALVGGLGPVVQVSLTERESLDDYRQWATRDDRTYQQLVTDLVYRGVRTTGRGTWYVSTAHTQADVDQTLDAFAQVLPEPSAGLAF